ncbi:MAG: hypothetical protein ACYTDX_08100 [Planctomycetota bacterium]|jgi:tetratricopeptide (TPR) repeat protein
MHSRARFPIALLLATSVAGLISGCGPEGPGPGEAEVTELEAALAEGRYGHVRRTVQTMERGNLDTPALRRRAAVLAMEVRDPALAAELLKTDAREDESVRLLRIEALIRSGQFADAETSLRKLEMKGQRSERWKVLQAMVAMGRGAAYWDTAKALVIPLVEGGSRDRDAWIYWAQFAAQKPVILQRRLLEALDKVAPEDQWAIRRALGRHLLSTAQGERAAQQLHKAVTERPCDRDARLSLVQSWRRDRTRLRLDDAIAMARWMVKEDPDDRDAMVALAETLGEKGRVAPRQFVVELQEAIGLYERVLEMVPATPGGQVASAASRTRILYLQGLARAHIELILADREHGAKGTHFQAAEALLKEAIDLDPEGQLAGQRGIRLTSESLYLLARALKRAKVTDDTVAIATYLRAIQMSPRHIQAHWDIALLYYDYLQTPGYVEKADSHQRMYRQLLQEAGYPPPAPDQMEIIREIEKRVKEGKGHKATDPKQRQGTGTEKDD